eukprot:TRINITY_DN22988_c0_g1_i1.p1 TRINITY_DN22988_c0_g1~~TRINITY_DN22988_c0_g1_i1.p1  ORF type:complete len:628 (+),score=234.37 TRINITY_DN22988_c0_g1_i1:228-1886(+)
MFRETKRLGMLRQAAVDGLCRGTASTRQMLRQPSVCWRVLMQSLECDGSLLQLARAMKAVTRKVLRGGTVSFLRLKHGREVVDNARLFAAVNSVLTELLANIKGTCGSNGWLAPVQYVVGMLTAAAGRLPDAEPEALRQHMVCCAFFFTRVFCPMMLRLHAILGRATPSSKLERRLMWLCKVLMRAVSVIVNNDDGAGEKCNEGAARMHELLADVTQAILAGVPGPTPGPPPPRMEDAEKLLHALLHSTAAVDRAVEGHPVLANRWADVTVRAARQGIDVELSYRRTWEHLMRTDVGIQLASSIQSVTSRSARARGHDSVASDADSMLRLIDCQGCDVEISELGSSSASSIFKRTLRNVVVGDTESEDTCRESEFDSCAFEDGLDDEVFLASPLASPLVSPGTSPLPSPSPSPLASPMGSPRNRHSLLDSMCDTEDEMSLSRTRLARGRRSSLPGLRMATSARPSPSHLAVSGRPSASVDMGHLGRAVVLKVKMDERVKLIRVQTSGDLQMSEVRSRVAEAFGVPSVKLNTTLAEIVGTSSKMVRCTANLSC